MSKLRKAIELETTYDIYRLEEQLGQGGVGVVYGGRDTEGNPVAVKVLMSTSMEKRKRFQNETAFLLRNQHPHIASVIDHGLATTEQIKGPFYVMSRYEGSLRSVIERRPLPDAAMAIFSQILDGVEAAHFQQVTHRDLKPENILVKDDGKTACVADFGIARFAEPNLHTVVETEPTTRLANFQYAAPEQRVVGQAVGQAADIYALGLILNELFTGSVPHGTDYKLIRSVAESFGFLDAVVALMLSQNPTARPKSIGEVKGLIQKYRFEAVTLQKLNTLTNTVVPAGQVDDPLADEPPTLIGASWENGVLKLKLDRPVSHNWIKALHNMVNYTSLVEAPPQLFRFNGAEVSVNVAGRDAQQAIDHFKQWLPAATLRLWNTLEQEAKAEEQRRKELLTLQREAEERHLSVNRQLKI